MTKLFTACTVTPPPVCTPPDGGQIEGTVTLTGVKDGYYNGLSATAKSAVEKEIAADIGKKVFSLCA